LLLAGVASRSGDALLPLRSASAGLSLLCLWVAYSHLARRGRRAVALFFTLLIALSPYFLGSAVRLATDNLALLFAFGSIALTTAQPRPRGWPWLVNSLILLAVLTRQTYIWLIGMYLSELALRPPAHDRRGWIAHLIPLILPVAALAFFIVLWRGLTPPAYAAHLGSTLNWEAPVYAVSLLGLYSAFFAPWWLHPDALKRDRWPLLALIAAGVIYLLVFPVSNAYPLPQFPGSLHDRGGALWAVVGRLPTLLGTGIPFWPLLALGLTSFGLLGKQLWQRGDHALVTGYALWLLTSLLNSRTYQKYYEPFTLFFVGAALVDHCPQRWRAWVGPLILLGGLAAISLTRF
jgi:hypothetical protein